MNVAKASFALVGAAVIGPSVKRLWTSEGQTVKLGSATGVATTDR